MCRLRRLRLRLRIPGFKLRSSVRWRADQRSEYGVSTFWTCRPDLYLIQYYNIMCYKINTVWNAVIENIAKKRTFGLKTASRCTNDHESAKVSLEIMTMNATIPRNHNNCQPICQNITMQHVETASWHHPWSYAVWTKHTKQHFIKHAPTLHMLLVIPSLTRVVVWTRAVTPPRVNVSKPTWHARVSRVGWVGDTRRPCRDRPRSQRHLAPRHRQHWPTPHQRTRSEDDDEDTGWSDNEGTGWSDNDGTGSSDNDGTGSSDNGDTGSSDDEDSDDGIGWLVGESAAGRLGSSGRAPPVPSPLSSLSRRAGTVSDCSFPALRVSKSSSDARPGTVARADTVVTELPPPRLGPLPLHSSRPARPPSPSAARSRPAAHTITSQNAPRISRLNM